MKKILLILLINSIVSNANAIQIADSSIAIVDMQQIITGSDAAKHLKDAAEKKSLEYEKEAKKLEDDLGKNNQDLSKQRSVLSEEAYAEKVKEFENRIISAQRSTQEKKIQLAQGFENGLSKISNTVSDIVDVIAKEKNLTLVLPNNSILYSKDNLYITEEVLKQLNLKLPNVELILHKEQSKSK